jgi:hypothetical protein
VPTFGRPTPNPLTRAGNTCLSAVIATGVRQ